MPVLIVNTSAKLPEGDARAAVMREASELLSRVLDKPIQIVLVSLNQVSAQMFGGDDSLSAAFCNVYAVGGVNRENNAALTEGIFGIMQKYTDVPGNRMFVSFQDLEVKGI
ncbi:hypothetical protein EON65_30610 [archaeon]|nr:MAG: hypothetical protein EON65_30610 [archaeon]